jgi:hypothetical protein
MVVPRVDEKKCTQIKVLRIDLTPYEGDSGILLHKFGMLPMKKPDLSPPTPSD